MIMSSDTTPEKNLYFIGAEVLRILRTREAEKYDMKELFEIVIETTPISFSLFMYSLDWLFILNLIASDNEGNILKCF